MRNDANRSRGTKWLGTKSARDSSSRPFKSAYTRSRLFLHAFLGLRACVRVQPLSLVDSRRRRRCLSHAGMTFRRTCSHPASPAFLSRRKKIETRRIHVRVYFIYILFRKRLLSNHLMTFHCTCSSFRERKNWMRNCLNSGRIHVRIYIYTFNYLDEDFIDFSLNEEWDLVNADISLHLLILLRRKKLSGIWKNPCSNIYSFSYLDEDFIEGRNETNLVV